MTDRHVDTIDIGKGVRYAKVASRLAAFHGDNDQCQIETHCKFKEGYALFTAKVTTRKGSFAGHSLGKVTAGQKQFEKQETIAVGRALAFAGYLSSGDIASQEEMQEFRTTFQGVTPDELNILKNKWATCRSKILADKDNNDKRRLFGEWVRQILGPNFMLGGELTVGDCDQWSRDDFRQCMEALAGPEGNADGING